MVERIREALAAYLDKILSLEVIPREVQSGSWKFSGSEWSEGSGSWHYEEGLARDWRTPLHLKHDEIFGSSETEKLVQAIHAETNARLPEIRGVMTDVAITLLERSNREIKDQFVDTLASELEELFTVGLPARFRSILSGIEVPSEFDPAEGVVLRPFAPDDWPSNLDPGQTLSGPDILHCSILEFDGRMPSLGQPVNPFDEAFYHWQKQHDKILRILRLFRVGGIISHLAGSLQTTLLRIPLHGSGTSGPPYSSNFRYRLYPEDAEPLKRHFEFLNGLPPWKHENLTSVDIALERYENALGPSKFREDILLYGIMGLEALFRKQHEGRQALVNRVALLMDLADVEDAPTVRETLDAAYRFRNPFVHGEALKNKEASKLAKVLKPLLDYLRIGVLLRMGLKLKKGRLLRKLDDSLLIPVDRSSLARKVAAVTERVQVLPKEAHSE